MTTDLLDRLDDTADTEQREFELLKMNTIDLIEGLAITQEELSAHHHKLIERHPTPLNTSSAITHDWLAEALWTLRARVARMYDENELRMVVHEIADLQRRFEMVNHHIWLVDFDVTKTHYAH